MSEKREDDETDIKESPFNEKDIKNGIRALLRHSDKLTTIVDEYGKKFYTLSKIVVGNGEVKDSIIWNLEKVKSETTQININLDGISEKIHELHELITQKLDRIEKVENRIEDIEREIAENKRSNDSFKERYLAPIVVSIIIGIIAFTTTHFISSEGENRNKNQNDDSSDRITILEKRFNSENK